MSRCFPYPPPGFERSNGAPNEALIESIKLQRESEKTRKERRKEKKREKKEKKEKKKEKSRAVGEVEKKEHSRKKRRKDEGCNVDHNGVNHPKIREDETEQLEKSSLTEEDGQPAGTMNLYDTSDSSKKMKHSLPSDGVHNQWPMLRIRLPLLKHKDSKVPISEEQRPCPTFERNKTIVQMKAPAIAPRPGKEQPPLSTTSGRIEIPVQDRVEPAVRSSFFESGSFKVVDLKFRDLIENWVPPPIQVEYADFDDQEWLFDMPPHSGEAKNIKANSGASSHVNLSLWPRACYLPEADVYALPYTVPY